MHSLLLSFNEEKCNTFLILNVYIINDHDLTFVKAPNNGQIINIYFLGIVVLYSSSEPSPSSGL